MELCQGGLGWRSGKGSSPEVLGTAQAPQGMGTAPRLPELQEGLDNALRDAQGGIVGVSVRGQELD